MQPLRLAQFQLGRVMNAEFENSVQGTYGDRDGLHRRYVNQRLQGGAAPRLDTDETYRTQAIKEAEGVECAQDFLQRLLRLELGAVTQITSHEDNLAYGDLRLPSGATVEVRRHAINPGRYPLNYVQVGELSFNPRYPRGLAELATGLQIGLEELTQVTVRDFRDEAKPVSPLGNPEFFTPLITAILASQVTMYVNPTDGFIYIYQRSEVVSAIRQSILNNNLRRGSGRNADGLAVLIPLPALRFRRDKKGLWRFDGPGKAEDHLPELRTLLSPKEF
jgi:hypothetical protein